MGTVASPTSYSQSNLYSANQTYNTNGVTYGDNYNNYIYSNSYVTPSANYGSGVRNSYVTGGSGVRGQINYVNGGSRVGQNSYVSIAKSHETNYTYI